MGPPGGAYARHRAPHPLQQQQQQPQYPPYQPSGPDSMYSMGDHAAMGLGDITGWGAATSAQGVPYGAPSMGGYGHPQAPQQQQRQSQSQPGYRQHMGAYPQQDPQKLQFSAQQNMLGGIMQQPGGYGAMGQPPQTQQQQQQRVPHYSQSGAHPIYPGAAQTQPAASQPYGAYQHPHQSSRSVQHVGYGHGIDQPG